MTHLSSYSLTAMSSKVYTRSVLFSHPPGMLLLQILCGWLHYTGSGLGSAGKNERKTKQNRAKLFLSYCLSSSSNNNNNNNSYFF